MNTPSRKLAAIDVGTNSFHLIVVDIKEDGSFEIIDREREVIRLGKGSGGTLNHLSCEAIERAIATLKRFRVIADSYSAEIRAVATSAVRESSNKKIFIEKVFAETGIEIEVIDGEEEARLIYLCAQQAIRFYNKKALIIDIGGGSTELCIGKEGKTIFSCSIKVGAVRLSDKYFPEYELTEARINECRNWIEKEISKYTKKIKDAGFDVCVGASGTIMCTALMIQAMKGEYTKPGIVLNNYEFSSEEFEKIKNVVLGKKTVEERKSIAGIDERRADIIPAGIIILDTVFNLLALKKMVVSGYSLREGIIIDSLQKLHGNS
jgi:exopolyphosphatase / guanosine-5'-triphosphate,3'-diphosphate pyrophosphatase